STGMLTLAKGGWDWEHFECWSMILVFAGIRWSWKRLRNHPTAKTSMPSTYELCAGFALRRDPLPQPLLACRWDLAADLPDLTKEPMARIVPNSSTIHASAAGSCSPTSFGDSSEFWVLPILLLPKPHAWHSPACQSLWGSGTEDDPEPPDH